MRFQADHLSLSDPASFYNAFFPIGYPLFLRACSLTASSPFPAALILQIVVAGIFAYTLYRTASTILPRTAALVATMVTLLLPSIIYATFSIGPDFFVGLCVLLAVYDLFEARPLRAGLWLGVGVLFRFHGLAYLFAMVVALVVLTREWRAIYRIVLGALPFIVIACAVQWWSAPHTAFSGTAFNVWKTIHAGVDWAHLPQHFDRSIIDVVSSEPGLFLHSYFISLRDSWYAWLPLVAFLIVVRRKPVAAIVRVVMLAALIYHLVTITGGSARGPVVILTFSVLAAIWTLLTLVPIPIEAKNVRRMALALTAGYSLVGIGFMSLAAMTTGDRVERYDQLANALQIGKAIAPDKIYSDDYALYFPSVGGATPRFSGGWPEIGLPSYAKRYPPLPDSTADAFRQALLREGITVVAFRGRPLNDVTFHIVLKDTAHFVSRGSIASYHVYDVK